jgi:hypothetical protein
MTGSTAAMISCKVSMMLLRHAVVVVGARYKDCGADILWAFGSAVLGEN